MWLGEAFCKPEPGQLEVRFISVNYGHCVTLTLLSSVITYHSAAALKYGSGIPVSHMGKIEFLLYPAVISIVELHKR